MAAPACPRTCRACWRWRARPASPCRCWPVPGRATGSTSPGSQAVRAKVPPPGPILQLGLSFKAGTDDLRNSPLLDLAEILVEDGYDLAIHDPDVDPARLIGVNFAVAAEHQATLMDRMTDGPGGRRRRGAPDRARQADPGRARAAARRACRCSTSPASRTSGERAVLADAAAGGGGLPARRLPSRPAADAAGAGAAAAADPVPLQPPAAADDPRRRAHRLPPARVPPRARPRGRLRHPDGARPPPAAGARGLAPQPLPAGRAGPAQPQAQPAAACAAGSAAGRSRSVSCSARPSSRGCASSSPAAATTWPTPITSARPRPCARPAAPIPASSPSWRCSSRRRSTPSGSPGPRRPLGPAVLPLRDPAHGGLRGAALAATSPARC